MNKRWFISQLIIILTLLFSINTFAATRTTSQSGNWSSSSTWGNNPPPVAGDDVIINGDFTVTLDIPSATCLSIQLGGSALGQGTGTLIFTNGSQVVVSGPVSIGPVNNNGTAGSVNMSAGGTLTLESMLVGRLGTWTGGTGTVEFTATNIIPTDNNIIFNNLVMSGGTTTISRNTDVLGELTINTGAELNGETHTLTLGGNWINNGTFTGNTGTVIFNKNGNVTITGTGINNFNLMKVDLGTSITNTLEVLSAHFNAPDAFLTIVNGTFKMSGTFTFSNSFFVGPIYNIQPTSGFWLNNPNVTVTAQAGGISVRGLLRLTEGTYNIGTAADHSLLYVSGSTIIIEGGAMHIAGQLTRNNATQTTSYTQTGGILSIVEQGSTDPVFGGFDLGVVGSSFNMSGGSIIIRNATSAPADFVNASSVATVTGGTLQTGDAGTVGSQTIRIQTTRPIGNLLVSNATAQLISSSLNVVSDITIQPGQTLNANGLNLLLGGNWIDDGTFTSGNTVTFNGSGAQAINRTGGETFPNLTVSKTSGTLTLNNSVTVNSSFSLTQGTLAVGNNILTLDGTVTGGGVLTSDVTGTVNYNQGSIGQNVLQGNYGNLTFSDFNKTLASSGTIGISSTFTPGTAVGHTVTGSTIDFNGGSQNIPAFTYNNLTLSGSGTKTGSGVMTVGGNLINNPGIIFTGITTLNLDGPTHTNDGTISTGTLSVGSGATITNNGTTSSGSALSGAGNFTQGSSGILNLGGTISITTLNASVSGNTVSYNGSGQTVKPVTYHHLTLSGSGTPVLTGLTTINGNFILAGTITTTAATGISIGGNFNIGNGTSFSASTFSHSLSGNLINSGTFNAGTSTFTLNGTSSQSISGVTFNNLSISNSAGVIIQADETINGTLTLSNGALSIGAHTLNLNGNVSETAGTITGGTTSNIVIGGSGAAINLPAVILNNLTLNRANGGSLSGDVTISGVASLTNGTLNTNSHSLILTSTGSLSETAGQPVVGTITTSRNITASTGTELFGNIGSDILLNGVAPGVTTVTRTTGIASTGNGHNSIKRYFDIAPTINSNLNAGLVFHYDLTELNGQNANNLEIYKSSNNGATWNNFGGTVNTTQKTITLSGINDFSRWTASDNTNSLGNTPIPLTASIDPSSKTVGDPAFIIIVNGNDFVSGKSVVRFNGSDRSTTFISSTKLTASIPASDLLIPGSFPITVFNAGGGGSSNAQTFIVHALPPAIVRVETAPDGSGTVVPAQSLSSGSSITVYAVTRDSLNNFLDNVSADAWSLQNIAGGVINGDLVPSPDNKSAVLTGHLVGSANIKSTSGSLPVTSSGTITIVPGVAAKIRVETSADGFGIIVPDDTLNNGTSITAYSISRDNLDNFIDNIAADLWSLQNITGGIVAGDLVPAPDNKSAVFTGHLAGSANIMATSGSLAPFMSGTITVILITNVETQNQPLTYALMQNYPNPFNPSTTIGFSLPEQTQLKINIYNVLGELVKTIAEGFYEAGTHSISFDASSLPSGTYIYRIESNNFVQTKKMLLLK
jgi:Secretion system C-terminal sorting domain